jgi:hypothetical protein
MMYRFRAAFTPLLVALAFGSTATASQAIDRNFMASFLCGEYIVIGKKPDSDATYQGRVTLRQRGLELEVTRVINGKTDHGTASFDSITADKIPVLRMRFTQGGKSYEGTFLWRSDLDNYGRLSGYVYSPTKGETKSLGLEALFPLAPLGSTKP